MKKYKVLASLLAVDVTFGALVMAMPSEALVNSDFEDFNQNGCGVVSERMARTDFKLYDVPMSEAEQRMVAEIATKYDIRRALVMAVIEHESQYNVDAVSGTDDYGLMQINSGNHEWLQSHLGLTDMLNAEQNVEAGCYMLSDLLHTHGIGTEDMALMAYNMGYNGAMEYWKQGIYSSEYSRKIVARANELEVM